MTEWWVNFWQSADVSINKTLWIVEVFIVTLATLIVNMVAKRVLDRVEARTDVSKNLWDDVLIRTARKPLRLLIWFWGLYWAAEITAANSEAAIFVALEPYLKA